MMIKFFLGLTSLSFSFPFLKSGMKTPQKARYFWQRNIVKILRDIKALNFMIVQFFCISYIEMQILGRCGSMNNGLSCISNMLIHTRGCGSLFLGQEWLRNPKSFKFYRRQPNDRSVTDKDSRINLDCLHHDNSRFSRMRGMEDISSAHPAPSLLLFHFFRNEHAVIIEKLVRLQGFLQQGIWNRRIAGEEPHRVVFPYRNGGGH